MEHLSDEQIEDFARLKLTPGEIGSVEEHLLICKSCRGRVVAAEDYADTMRQALEDVGEESEKEKAAVRRRALRERLN